MSRLGRSQRYHRRPRTIYALVFHGGQACYIGQAEDLNEAVERHCRPHADGWTGSGFDVIELEAVMATPHDAIELVQVWHVVAWRRGLSVLRVPCDPDDPIGQLDPARRPTWTQVFRSWTRPWPSGASRPLTVADRVWTLLTFAWAGVLLLMQAFLALLLVSYAAAFLAGLCVLAWRGFLE